MLLFSAQLLFLQMGILLKMWILQDVQKKINLNPYPVLLQVIKKLSKDSSEQSAI